MQLAKFTLKTAAAAAMLAAATSALSLQPALPPVGASAPAAPTVKPINAAAVQAVNMGVGPTNTVGELEKLQRELTLAEMRKKLKEITKDMPVEGPVAAPSLTASQPSGQVTLKGRSKIGPTKPSGVAAKSNQFPQTLPFVPFASGSEFVERPNSKVLKIIIVGGRARADLISNGKVTTVKIGDSLGRWRVSEIKADGVTIERSTAATANAAASGAPASLLPAAQPNMQLAAQSRGDIETFRLPKASDSDVLQTGYTPPGSTHAGLAAQAGFPHANQAPMQQMQDSSFTPPALPPLPAR